MKQFLDFLVTKKIFLVPPRGIFLSSILKTKKITLLISLINIWCIVPYTPQQFRMGTDEKTKESNHTQNKRKWRMTKDKVMIYF